MHISCRLYIFSFNCVFFNKELLFWIEEKLFVHVSLHSRFFAKFLCWSCVQPSPIRATVGTHKNHAKFGDPMNPCFMDFSSWFCFMVRQAHYCNSLWTWTLLVQGSRFKVQSLLLLVSWLCNAFNKQVRMHYVCFEPFSNRFKVQGSKHPFLFIQGLCSLPFFT